MEAEAVEKVEGEKAQLENKFALIVVGRMGHGKSSFCKMIVNDSEKSKVEAHVSIKSGTLDCKIYTSNRFHDIFGQEILVIDTPGLDSKTSVSLVIEDIDDLVLNYKLHIVGIAYVLNVMEREQDQQGGSHIFSFLDFLRIKYCHKINLTFCVLSKYDKNYQDEETMEELMQQFSEIFEENGYSRMWKRHIQWMSQPVKDQKIFQKKIKGSLKDNFQNQYVNLSQFFKTKVEEGQIVSFKTYEEDRKQFQSLIKYNLSKEYDKFQFSTETNFFELLIQLQQVSKAQKRINVAASTFMGGGSIAMFAIAASSVGIFSLVVVPLVVGIGSLAGGGYLLYKTFSKRNGSVNSKMSEEEKQQVLNSRIKQKLKGCLISSVAEQVKLNNCTFTFVSLPYIYKIQAFDEKGQSIPVIRSIEKDDKQIYKAQLITGKNRIQFTYKMPTTKYYEHFLRQMSRLFYNKKS